MEEMEEVAAPSGSGAGAPMLVYAPVVGFYVPKFVARGEA